MARPLSSPQPDMPISHFFNQTNWSGPVAPPPTVTAPLPVVRAYRMAASKENPIILYDILSEHGTWSPNTYKTRLTLNYKRLPYLVEYVSYPDVAPKLKELGVRATNPTSYISYTLPSEPHLPRTNAVNVPLTTVRTFQVIADPSPDPNGKPTYVVESFDIAVYLDKTYPAPKYPPVFPPGTRAVQKIVSDLYMNQVGYMVLPVILPLTGRPGFLDERGREHFLKARQEIFKKFPTDTTIGSKYWGEIHEKWNWFGEMLDLNEEGPFVTGKQISFTDFAIGGIISALRRVEGGEMRIWKAISEWQGGRWARHWAEIEKLEKDSTEVV